MTAWFLSWMWQGLALAFGIAAVLRLVGGTNAATRHVVWAGGLAAIAALGLIDAGALAAGDVTEPSAVAAIYVPSAPQPLVALFGGVWAVAVLVGAFRLVRAFHAVFALRRQCTAFPADVEARLPLWLEARTSGRSAGLVICDALPGATVLGLRRPRIALPSALVGGLSHAELDQVILHEHAHVRRGDDWWRLAQSLLMSVLWVHPAAVVASRALNREREIACDEWVIARTGRPKEYARCLVRAAELQRCGRRHSAHFVPALLSGRGELTRRVERLLTHSGGVRSNVSLVRATAAAVAIAAASSQVPLLTFAELAEVVLPSVANPLMPIAGSAAAVPQADPRLPVATRARRAAVAGRVAAGADARAALPDKPIAFETVAAEDAAVEPVAASLTARTFEGTYAIRPRVNRPSETPSPWRAMAAPGVEIASAARKTSIGLAAAFSRAGSSLARSF